MPSDEESVLSTLYHSLRAERRRRVITLVYHHEDDEPIAVRRLARLLAAAELEVQPKHATGEPYRNVYNALSKTHLPTLGDAGIIIYDSDRQTVSPAERLTGAALMVAVGPPMVQFLWDTSLEESHSNWSQ